MTYKKKRNSYHLLQRNEPRESILKGRHKTVYITQSRLYVECIKFKHTEIEFVKMVITGGCSSRDKSGEQRGKQPSLVSIQMAN